MSIASSTAATKRLLRMMGIVLAMAGSTPWHATVRASDTRAECTALDPDMPFRLDAESKVLRKSGIAEPMKYKTVEHKRLRKVEGYCTTKAGLFKFKTDVYGITVEVMDGGRPLTLRFRCEVGEDATPAGLNCDREVETQNFKAPLKYDNYR